MSLNKFIFLKKGIIHNVIINIFATLLCTFVLNFFLYPRFAKIFSNEIYGQILTGMGVVNLLFSTIGNSLNNVRLLLNKRNEFDNTEGGYNRIIILTSLLGTIIGTYCIVSLFYISFFNTLMVIALLFIGQLRAYYVVDYRLRLNYNKQLLSNCSVALGYVFGVFFCKKISIWPLPFLLGEFFALLFAKKNTLLFKEHHATIQNMKIVISTYIPVCLCSLVANVQAYLDRFLINPVLGSASVTVFSVASFWGRCFGPFIAPTANVVLSYLNQKNSLITKKKFVTMFVFPVIGVAVLYLIGIIISPWVTKLFYPTIVDKALPYMNIINLAILIKYISSLIMPIIMTVCPMNQVLILESLQCLVYVVGLYIGAKNWGLLGAGYALIIINSIKVIMNFCFGYRKVKYKEDK